VNNQKKDYYKERGKGRAIHVQNSKIEEVREAPQVSTPEQTGFVEVLEPAAMGTRGGGAARRYKREGKSKDPKEISRAKET